MQSTNLTNHFLIAMPNLADPNFFHTVTYLCAHNDDGAMGIVINRPLELLLSDMFKQMDIIYNPDKAGNTPVFHGGPVQTDRGFVLHRPQSDWDSSIQVSEQIEITTSRDILQAIANGDGPVESLVALGYAGWAAGQLEQEIKGNAWLCAPADCDIIFNTTIDKRWQLAAHTAGIDLDKLTGEIGHA